ncbi:MAG: hypothetical protein K2X11_00750 [Acetobacteraceae bacterium]|nr:hypothetical protein [Acetobacteraceae bacterium]
MPSSPTYPRRFAVTFLRGGTPVARYAFEVASAAGEKAAQEEARRRLWREHGGGGLSGLTMTSGPAFEDEPVTQL